MDKPLTRGAKTQQEVSILLRAKNTLLLIVTKEELRVTRAVIEAATSIGSDVRIWDCADGTRNAAGEEAQPGTITDPDRILNYVRNNRERVVWILKDFHAHWKVPVTQRLLRNVAMELQGTPKNESRAIVVIAPTNEVPAELSGHVTTVEWPIPDRGEIAAILDDIVETLPEDIQKTVSNGIKEKAIDAAVGLTTEQASASYAYSLVKSKAIDYDIVGKEKKRLISQIKGLRWADGLPGGLDAVGGNENLKYGLSIVKQIMSQKARDRNISAPKGFFLCGVPGCGKTHTAKALATDWGIPLLWFDAGGSKSKYVGESESNFRLMLSTVETMAPCILIIDEIEKMFAGASGPAGDGGVAADALGTILSWLQERESAVFVIATANNVAALPPELLRKGRFDEFYFVDLPTVEERVDVLRATMLTEKCEVKVDLKAVARASEGFSGAEVASLVRSAKIFAFIDGDRKVATADLLRAASEVVPQSKLAADKITAIREWASKNGAKPAGKPDVAVKGKRELDL
jgi:AAA+ superfamily predicted ATPase